ncbi:periplasmic heavy metal sensor [Roseobacter sinensis]|uniref:Periplasmic heavy metal sensor n=1 Tax=Roseobacter sinensis TaxID=2931391 RepID=A0ABT3BCB2_9RHOB|nr:periplasmic heavy metal sensor [Roseobacter sp. WL0113]MCV3271213.1 periplasmic heavy metal sensor [Roseobacter sp. WL0113]
MQDTTPPKGSAPRWIKIVLGLSLAFNFAVIGLIGGAVLRHGDGKIAAARSSGFGAYGLPYMIALPRDDRRAVRRAVRSGVGVPDREARRALYRDVLATLRATPFDPSALAGAMSRQAETTIAVQKAAQGAWLEVVSDMSDAERSAYADAVEEVLRRGPKTRR